jgi:hypothetical protein
MNAATRISERLDLFTEMFRTLERGFSIETLNTSIFINIICWLLSPIRFVSAYERRIRKGPGWASINFMLENLNRKFKR